MFFFSYFLQSVEDWYGLYRILRRCLWWERTDICSETFQALHMFIQLTQFIHYLIYHITACINAFKGESNKMRNLTVCSEWTVPGMSCQQLRGCAVITWMFYVCLWLLFPLKESNNKRNELKLNWKQLIAKYLKPGICCGTLMMKIEIDRNNQIKERGERPFKLQSYFTCNVG